MLDVHPPHHAATTFRDFLVHIATIVVGLLIAIGLEQAVEYLHQRYELRETREALQRESESNRIDVTKDVQQWRWEIAELENNLLVLRYIKQHPGTAQTSLPGVLMWDQSPVLYESAVWDAAEQNGITRYMPPVEANRYRSVYLLLKTIGLQGMDDWNAYNDAGRYRSFDDDPTHMTAAEVDRTLQALQVNIEKHIQVGYSLALTHNRFPELGAPLTFAEIAAFQPDFYDNVPAGLEGPYKLTQDRIKTTTNGVGAP